MRRSDPDIVQNGHIYSSIREEDVSYIRRLLWVTQRILWAGLIIIRNWIISQRKIVFGMQLRACDEGFSFSHYIRF